MTVFRIVLKKYAKALFAPGFAGRWNADGNKVIYTAGSIAIAYMENMVRRNGYGFNDHFAVMHIELPESISTTIYTNQTLPPGWNAPGNYAVSQQIGDAWYNAGQTTVLQVPSVIVPQEYNYVLHTLHPDFSAVQLKAVTEFIPDARIEEILKK
jgi:RES domain-containing protein